MPFLSLYAAWTSRQVLGAAAPRPGLALTVLLVAAVLAGGAERSALSVRAVAIPLACAAVVLAIGGVVALRRLMFPVGFLVFMIPIPAGAIGTLSPSLQRLAATTAEHALRIATVPVTRVGLELQIGRDVLEINETCNGLRFLLTMTVVGVAVAWAIGRNVATRVIVVGVMIGSAVVANLARVEVTAMLTSRVGVLAATGPAHLLYGKAVYGVFAAAAVVGLWRYVAAGRSPRRPVDRLSAPVRSVTAEGSAPAQRSS